MIAERTTIPSYSDSNPNELGLDGHCDFGFPAGHHAFGHLVHSANSAATLPRVSSDELDLRSSKLDEVVRCFSKVYDGNDIDIDLLLKACRCLLELIQSNGAALRLAARDLDANLRKVEVLFRERPAECRTLASLLKLERQSGIHDGNVLGESSAAMGLLWIRRSLSFQSHLYHESLVRSDARHPRDVAVEAYGEHLSPYHGWMLRTAFPASFSGMPNREVILSRFGEVETEDLDGEEEARVVQKLRTLIETLEPLLREWKAKFVELDLEDLRRV